MSKEGPFRQFIRNHPVVFRVLLGVTIAGAAGCGPVKAVSENIRVQSSGNITSVDIGNGDGLVISRDPKNSGFDVFVGDRIYGCHLPAGPCGSRSRRPITIVP